MAADAGISSTVRDGNRKLLKDGDGETGTKTAKLVVTPSPGTGPSTRTCPNSCSLKGHLNGQPVTVFSNALEFHRITKTVDNSCAVTTLLKGQFNAVTDSLFMTGCIELSCLYAEQYAGIVFSWNMGDILEDRCLLEGATVASLPLMAVGSHLLWSWMEAGASWWNCMTMDIDCWSLHIFLWWMRPSLQDRNSCIYAVCSILHIFNQIWMNKFYSSHCLILSHFWNKMSFGMNLSELEIIVIFSFHCLACHFI